MRRARRADRDQVAIVAALRKAGCFVEVLSDVGRGVPDLLVTKRTRPLMGRDGFVDGAKLFLMEIKTDNEALSAHEAAWQNQCHWQVDVVRCVDDALKVVGVKP